MPIKKNLVDLKFGKLLVISEDSPHTSPSGRLYIMWKCQCDCGNFTIVRSSALTSNCNKTKSCGCLSAEMTAERTFRHGMSNSREYTSFTAMHKRCSNSNDPAYSHYGGRGISVCERWSQSEGQGFINFVNDLGIRPKGTTIDRKDNNGNYEPNNCRWATKSDQQRNRNKKKDTLSKFKGVSWDHIRQGWSSACNGKTLGMFDFEQDAAEAYNNYIIFNKLVNPTNRVEDYDESHWD